MISSLDEVKGCPVRSAILLTDGQMCHCSRSEPHLMVKAQNEALQEEVQYLRQLLSFSGISVSNHQKQHSPCPSHEMVASYSAVAVASNHTSGSDAAMGASTEGT